MKKTIALLLILCVATTGCTGSFNLTKKVYNFHRSQGDKWKDEIFFLVCALLPIYGFSTFADAIVFNSIEFWTGENPVVLNSTNEKVVKDKSSEATLSFNSDSKAITIASNQKPTVILERKDGMVLAKDEKGKILYTTLANDKGDVMVYDQNLELVKTYSSKDMNALKEKYIQ